MKRFLRVELIALIALILPFLIVLFKWNDFPERVPIHFNIDGRPDRFASKFWGLLMLPMINIAVYALLRIVPTIDPLRSNFLKFETKYRMLRVAIHVFLAFMFVVTAAFALGFKFNMSLVITYSVLFLFLVIGNYLGSVKQNYFVGVRTPWTLASEEVWKRTHVMSARLWVSASFLAMILLPFSPRYPLLLVYIAVIAIPPIVYSYVVFQRLSRRKA